MKSLLCLCCLLAILAPASVWPQTKVPVRPGSISGYVFSPKPTALLSTTVTTNSASENTCFSFRVSTSSITTEGTVTTKAALGGLDFVGTGSVKNGLFTGVLHLEHCEVMDLNNSAGSANVINNNKCPASRGGSGNGATTYTRCPNSWVSSTIYGAGAGACILLTAANIAAGGPNGGTYFSYVEVTDLPVNTSAEIPCP